MGLTEFEEKALEIIYNGFKDITKEINNLKNAIVELGEHTFNLKGHLESKQPDLEYTNVKEEVLQDLTNVTIITDTAKAILTVKSGYQKWVPLRLIHAPKTYDLGGTYDIILRKKQGEEKTDPDNWFHKKSWDKYEPQKKGG